LESDFKVEQGVDKLMWRGCLNGGRPQSGTRTLPVPRKRAERQPRIKLTIKRVYKNVPYEIEADINSIESAEQIVSLMQQAEQFIDKMLGRGSVE